LVVTLFSQHIYYFQQKSEEFRQSDYWTSTEPFSWGNLCGGHVTG